MSEDVFKFISSNSSAASDFVRIEDGETIQLRIISQPLMGHELFVEGKPHRWPQGQSKPAEVPAPGPDDKVKNFVSFIVYQYTDEPGIKVWSISQKTILKQMEVLFNGGREHWSTYVLTIRRKGLKKDTTYSVSGTGVPLEDSLIDFATKAKDYIDMSAMFVGDSVVIQPLPEISVEQAQPKTNTDALPF